MLQRNSNLTLNMHIEGRALLMKAACEGDLQLVISLLREGFDVNARDKDGDTALMFAAHRGHYLIVKTVLTSSLWRTTGGQPKGPGERASTGTLRSCWSAQRKNCWS
jgi:ankyrin repeat protein